jgi:hypothetical protein
MAVDEILQDLLSNPLPHSKSQQPMTADPPGSNESPPPGPDALILALERQCSSTYEDPGPGTHFVGILLAVFAAEIVSGYWATNGQRIRGGSDPGPARLLSCLYSGKAVAFVLAHPFEVVLRYRESSHVDARKAAR